MWDELELSLLGALAQVARKRLGNGHPFVAACDAGDIRALRTQLDALPPADSDALLAAAHKQLREDPSALLKHWPSNRQGRPN